jgi:hypothetical protein
MAQDLQSVVVHLDGSATDPEVDEVREALRSSGLTAEVRTDWQKEPGTGNGAFWMVAIDILRESIPQFIGGLGVAGTAALVTKLRRARRSAPAPDGWVELRDRHRTHLMVGEAVEEAFEKLPSPELVLRRSLRYDERTRQWVPY